MSGGNGAPPSQLEDKDFPRTFQVTNNGALETQRKHFLLFGTQLWLSIAVVSLSLFGTGSKGLAIVAVVLLVVSIGVTILSFYKNYERRWYNSRAIAESVKTLTWRYMVRAKPFEAEIDADALFLGELRELVNQNRELISESIGTPEMSSITHSMEQVRAQEMGVRREFYLSQRVNDQKGWYTRKAKFNKKWRRVWFGVMVALQGVALVLAIIRVAYVDWERWPIDIFVVASASALSWTQAKRHRDLEAAYAWTLNDIAILAEDARKASTEERFSKFVQDAENAFSREHTQWLARKDNIL